MHEVLLYKPFAYVVYGSPIGRQDISGENAVSDCGGYIQNRSYSDIAEVAVIHLYCVGSNGRLKRVSFELFGTAFEQRQMR